MAHVEELRVHANMERTPVSKTTKDLIDHCLKLVPEDPLIFHVKENPFKEKKSCAIL